MSEWVKLCEKMENDIMMQEFLVPRTLIKTWHDVKAEGDRLQDKLNFIQKEYVKCCNEKLTRDALCLKIAVLEQRIHDLEKNVNETKLRKDET